MRARRQKEQFERIKAGQKLNTVTSLSELESDIHLVSATRASHPGEGKERSFLIHNTAAYAIPPPKLCRREQNRTKHTGDSIKRHFMLGGYQSTHSDLLITF